LTEWTFEGDRKRSVCFRVCETERDSPLSKVGVWLYAASGCVITARQAGWHRRNFQSCPGIIARDRTFFIYLPFLSTVTTEEYTMLYRRWRLAPKKSLY